MRGTERQIGIRVTVLQRNRLRWYGHVLRKDDGEYVKKCMDFVVEGVRTRGSILGPSYCVPVHSCLFSPLQIMNSLELKLLH